MKLAITGKGGTGKTTLAGILAHFLNHRGFQVLAVDADPDANLASAIGLSPEQAASIVPVSEQRELIKERTGANPKEFGQLFKMNPTVGDIPERFCVTFRGIKLLVMGAVRKGGAGCACPESVLLKSLLSEILLARGEAVVVDMEAGIEHLGRATAGSIDRMLIVVEPGHRSLETAGKILRMGEEIGIRHFGIVGNKIRTEKQKLWLAEQFPAEWIAGMISYHDVIGETDLSQKPLIDVMSEGIKREFNSVCEAVIATDLP